MLRSRRLISTTVAAALVVGSLAGPAVVGSASANAATTKPKRMMSGWMPYWTTKESLKSFEANIDLFSDVSPFWHNATRSSSTGSLVRIENNWLSYSNRAALIDRMHNRGVAIMPSITDGTGAMYMRQVLRNPKRRSALVAQITKIVVANRYDGIDLDFEKFAFNDGQSTWAGTRPAWVAFIASLASALHAKGKKLAVAVPPMGVPGNDYWVYAWPQIAPHIDKLRIMAYDYSWDSPGPVGGPLSWVAKLAQYARSVVPAYKIQMGTPTYGRDWVKSKSGTGCPSLSSKTYDSRDIGSVLGVPANKWTRDSASAERVLRYTVKYNRGRCTVSRVAFVPDDYTVRVRARQASRFGLGGIATWMVGSEQWSQWAGLRRIARNKPFATQPVRSTATSKRSLKAN